jgi:hypothetical protein
MIIENKKTLVLACSRSGHHAVINWIISQMKGKVFFHNNCMRGWEVKKLFPVKLSNIIEYKNTDDEIVSDIYSIEEFDMDFWEKYNFEEFDIDNVIIINRDVKNWIASRIKGHGGKNLDLFTEYKNISNISSCGQIQQWCKLMNETMGVTDIIQKPKMDISFNKWHTDVSYRMNISDRLNIEFKDSDKDKVSRFGGGSSFQKSQKEDAKKLNVLNRYIEMSGNQTYQSHISDKRMLEALSLDIKYREMI